MLTNSIRRSLSYLRGLLSATVVIETTHHQRFRHFLTVKYNIKGFMDENSD